MSVLVLTDERGEKALLYDSVTELPIATPLFRSGQGEAEEMAGSFLDWMHERGGIVRGCTPGALEELRRRWAADALSEQDGELIVT